MAVSVEQGQMTIDLHEDIPDIMTLLDVCASFVTIDEKTNTVRLVHYTVQEYLVNNRIIPRDADLRLATTCMTFLSFDIFGQACSSRRELVARLWSYPLLSYTVQHLCSHLSTCSDSEHRSVEPFLGFHGRPGNLSSYLQASHNLTHMLKSGAYDPNIHNYLNGKTLLHVAAALGQSALVRWLLRETHAMVLDNRGQTPLHHAAFEGHEPVTRLLLKKITSSMASISDKNGQTALHNAANQGHEPIVRLLLEKGVDIEATGYQGRTALHMTKDREIARLLLEKGADISATDNKGQIALHIAADQGHVAMAELLIEKGADISATDNGGQTALQIAADQGRVAMAELLLEKGADISATDKQGRTALLIAVDRENPGTVVLLLEGADISATDNEGQTALHIAVDRGHIPIVRLLLGKGADTSATDKQGRTVLQIAKAREIARLLPKMATEILATDNGGQTALYTAVDQRRAAMAREPIARKRMHRELRRLNCAISSTDSSGDIVLDKAKIQVYDWIVDRRRQNGANTLARNNRGQTPSNHAASRRDKSILLLLEKYTNTPTTDSEVRAAPDKAASGDRGSVLHL